MRSLRPRLQTAPQAVLELQHPPVPPAHVCGGRSVGSSNELGMNLSTVDSDPDLEWINPDNVNNNSSRRSG